MRARHVTSDSQYRDPFGAIQVGGAVFLSIDVWDEPDATARLRLWTDDRGERLLEMRGEPQGDHLRFSLSLVPEEAELVWYSFQVTAADGAVWRYGAATEHGHGEGAFAFGEPPSFQLTVYERRRTKQPEWFKGAVAYQIFPDRFARGEGWQGLVETGLSRPRRGPARRLVDDWSLSPRYERTEEGRIAAWDFYGGTLGGIRERLGYLEALGIGVIYLNPIFEAASNHRYDTADYLRIDPMLGSEEDFRALCLEAASHGISIILDGVFNHVGADSRYFNRYGNYGSSGACQDEHSPYREWFSFEEDGSYDSWWGVDDLPAVREDSASFRELICGHDGVVRKWLRLGARGWRLDVADELSDEFIEDIKAAALAERPDAVVIGEVWEDASNKRAYGRLRRYFQGLELDGSMNYPLRGAILDYLTNKAPASALAGTLESLQENYPRENLMCELNMLGSHDRARLLTLLGDAPDPDGLSEEGRAAFRLGDDQRSLAVSRLWIAALLQMTLPGVPCVYYGDEAGLEGYADPFNRGSFPWGAEDHDCLDIYRNAIALRKALPVLVDGDAVPFSVGEDVFGFWRTGEGGKVCVLVNASLESSHTVRIPAAGPCADDVVSGRACPLEGGEAEVFLWPLGSSVISFHEGLRLQAPLARGMGVLCHISSLPNPHRPGQPGTLGEPAYRFVDMLAAAGQRYWQVLPVNPTDAFGSPYAGNSAFAGNAGLMWGGSEGEGPTAFSADFEGTPEYRRFLEENEDWLLPYACYATIKGRLGGLPWQEWPQAWRSWDEALASQEELAAGVRHACGVQYAFMRQWGELRRYANERGVRIIGDMPMYVSADSADVWASRELFVLDEAGAPALQAGAPPDDFARDGQLWGNPTYNWRLMRAQGYAWWLRRLRRAFELYDYVRLDHFLGFSSYYTIPKGKTVPEGSWSFGPGLELFERAREELGPLPVVAEDLGSITPAVRALVSATGFPGMDVIQFSDGDVREGYRPAPGKLVYSSTHDTNTLLGWCEERYGQEAGQARDLAGKLLESCLASEAQVVMVPLQDVLSLGAEARMNVPGVAEGNWRWQAGPGSLEEAGARLVGLARRSGRLGGGSAA